jgi:hypothetical protein
MSKTKSGQAKRAQARADKSRKRARERERISSLEAVARTAAAQLQRKKRADSLEHFVSSEYEFWLLHGMNFLTSNYAEGVWSPLFPDIYETGFDSLDRTTIMKRLSESHLDPETNRLSETGTRCFAWVALKPKEMWELVFRIRRSQTHELRDKSWIESRKPANPSVWSLIYEAMNFVSAGLEAKGRTKDGQFTLPEGGAEALTQ